MRSIGRLTYNTDVRKVYQLINGFVEGETVEKWIKPKERKKEGRLNYLSLLAHYGGECKKAVQVKEAEALRKSLIYNIERAMSFDKLLTNMQTMFT